MKRLTLTALTLASTLIAACDSTTKVPNPGPVQSNGSFALTLSSSMVSLNTGASGSITATPVFTNGYNQNITYSATGDSTLVVAQVASALNTFVVSSTVVGTHTLTVTAKGSDGQTRSASATINVTTAGGGNNGGNFPDNGPAAGIHIPAAGAVIGSGDGTKIGTIYVSPTQDEIDVLNLVNEVRTKGTVNGVSATAGTCVSGTWSPRSALTYNGLFAYAARKHALYMSNVGYEEHTETATNSTYFYGVNPSDRIVKVYQEKANLAKSYSGTNTIQDGGELVGTGTAANTAAIMVNWWMNSPVHCNALMNTDINQMGSGYAYAAPNLSLNQQGNSWDLIVGR